VPDLKFAAVLSQRNPFVLSCRIPTLFASIDCSDPHITSIDRPSSLSAFLFSCDTALAMSSFNRSATVLSPLLLWAGPRVVRRAPRTLPRQLPAVAILLPGRLYATDTSTSGGGDNGPPPGFNMEQAKRPLPNRSDQQGQQTAAAAEAASDRQALRDEVKIPKDQPTSHPPTKAAENATLSELAADKAAADKAEEKKLAKKEEEKKKLTMMQKIKKEALHYWDGTKLLATEARISTKLALKMAAGYELSRREHRQVSP
jgi:LETM1 and EF-hand domain-containing protein 1, mitochondrial